MRDRRRQGIGKTLQPVGVRVESLAFTAGRNEILNGITLDIPPDESLSIVGQSGSGKTTFLRCVAGLQPASAGTIEFYSPDGQKLTRSGVRLGFVFQDLGIFERSSARQNIVLSDKSLLENEYAEEIIGQLQIGGILDRKVDNLSGGERQRIAAARALVRRPQVLFMDEPFSNIDRALAVKLEIALAAIRCFHPFTLLYVTHNIKSAARMSARIAFMTTGVFAQVGAITEFRKSPAAPSVLEFFADPPAIQIVAEDWSWVDCDPPRDGNSLYYLHPRALHLDMEQYKPEGAHLAQRGRFLSTLADSDETYFLVELARNGEIVMASTGLGQSPFPGDAVRVWATPDRLGAIKR